MNQLTIKQAAKKIEEFFSICTAKLGGPWEINRENIGWVKEQAEATPSAEPNLFRGFDTIMEGGETFFLVPHPDKRVLLKSYGFSDQEIEAFDECHCPFCG